MTHPGEQHYPPGVRWDAAIVRGTLPELLAQAARAYGDRPALEFRDRPISFEVFSGELPEMEEQARRIAAWGPSVYVRLRITNTRG